MISGEMGQVRRFSISSTVRVRGTCSWMLLSSFGAANYFAFTLMLTRGQVYVLRLLVVFVRFHSLVL